jgi:glycogen phosphorylase
MPPAQTLAGSNVPTPGLPPRIEGLLQLATNLWWSWQYDARELIRSIDQRLWHTTRHNVMEVLLRVSPERIEACAADPAFLARYDRVMAAFARLNDVSETWVARRYPELLNRPIAYFCAEFALHTSLPVYSGGLGVLAGDHCKESSDLGLPVVGVGLFYVKGYFDQRLRSDGWQEDAHDFVNTVMAPLTRVIAPDGSPTLTTLHTDGRDVRLGAWRLQVGRVALYLLDTDIEGNDPADRELAARLYTGNEELRLRQEWILGVGGVRVLRTLAIEPVVWHANEGHAAFLFVERLRELVLAGHTAAEAMRRVRATSVFTTHTPVPAGHDTFPVADVERVAGPFWDEMGITRDEFMRLGHTKEADGRYHMTVTALRLAGRVNAVAAQHGLETRRLWRHLWVNRPDARVPIGHVTNGVHVATWMAPGIRRLLREHLGAEWETRLDEPELWLQVLELNDAALWAAHQRLTYHLHSYIREEARHRWRDQWKDPAQLAAAGALLNPANLTIGFARRFATYKRADLLLRDPERLRRLLVNPLRPVQLIFAGKAHPADDPGKQVLQRVYTTALNPRFEGRIAFLEDYEMNLAHRLVQGVDLWLNMPRAPLEACGTSGMKAALNAVPQISTLDGWWVEGFTGMNGWAVPAAAAGADVDESDCNHFFDLLENDVVPRFYDRRPDGVPAAWVGTMKHALRTAGERFTARRMVQEYVRNYYAPAARGESPPAEPPAD